MGYTFLFGRARLFGHERAPRFVAQLFDGEPMTEARRAFGISRKTGYKIFSAARSMASRPNRPIASACALCQPAAQQVESLILSLKRDKPHWGARIIRELLARRPANDVRVSAQKAATVTANASCTGYQIQYSVSPATAFIARRFVHFGLVLRASIMIVRYVSSLQCLPTRRLAAWVLTLIAAAAVPAMAQPADGQRTGKQIRFVVPFAAGGTLDILARAIGKELGPALGQTVIVENRPGASGAIGAEAVARGAPDGSMIMIMSNTLATLPAMRPDLPFNIEKDLAPIIEVGSTPTVMTLHPSFPARTTSEFIAAAKAMPDGVNYTSPAIASAPHLAGELLASVAGIKLVHIAYRGTQPAVTDLVAGQVKMMMAPLSNVLPFFPTKQLIPIAMTDDKRSPSLPDVPTLQESGVPQMRPMAQWYGIMTTGGTPPDVIARYNSAIQKILSDPGVRATLEAQTFVIKTNTPQQFSAHLREEISQVAVLIKDANIRQ